MIYEVNGDLRSSMLIDGTAEARLADILTIMDSRTFPKRESEKIVGGPGRLRVLVNTQRVIVSKIKNTMEKENQNEKRIYQLSASIGCSVHASDEIDDLNQLIESADKRMYEEKKEKHMRR